ncbi:MAG: DMT family transporter [Synergistaceae bacterium]|nr:DMT family transporter [Synergistaceae bacterium]
MPLWGFLMSMLVAFMWALSPVFIKEGMKYCAPNEVPAVRSISFIIVMVFFMMVTQPGTMPRLTPALFAGSFANALISSLVGDLLYTYAIQKIGASLAVAVSSGYPIVSALISIFVLNEKMSALVWLGTVMIVTGIFVIKMGSSSPGDPKAVCGPDSGDRNARRANMAKGISLALATAFCYGINIPIMKILIVDGGWSPTENYFMRSVIFFFLTWTMREIQYRFTPGAIQPVEKLPLKAWTYLTLSSIFGISLSGILFGMCLARFPVSVVTPICASSPFMTLIFARVFLKEKLSKIQGAGIVMVIAGSISVSL